jgi:hypothetical protein
LFDDSAASQRHQTAYIAHLISTILLKRVFTPFLFGLGNRTEETEILLEKVSNQLRAKSSRKEATWRQHTLLAAYTTTDAKLRMNKEAGRAMDEIVGAILPFCAESEAKEDEVRVAVRKIVKLAVETWRYARLEREKIEALMPPVDDEAKPNGEEGFWIPYGDQGLAGANANDSEQNDKKVLLRVFPIIRREQIQEGFRSTEKDCNDKGCVYSKGLALYAE